MMQVRAFRAAGRAPFHLGGHNSGLRKFGGKIVEAGPSPSNVGCFATTPSSNAFDSPFRQSSTLLQEEIKSRRGLFKDTEVNPSILKHIQNLGVGIPDRSRRSRKPTPTRSSSTGRQRHNGGGALIDPRVEEEFLRNRGRSPRRRRPSNNNAEGSSSTGSAQAWLPPPPFASTAKDTTQNGRTVRRHPVRITASVGSFEESFPGNTAGLPEVVSITACWM